MRAVLTPRRHHPARLDDEGGTLRNIAARQNVLGLEVSRRFFVSLGNDFRCALRAMRRNPGFSAIAILPSATGAAAHPGTLRRPPLTRIGSGQARI